MSKDDKAEFIIPPTQLKDKVSVSQDGVDLEALERAEALIAGMQDSYLEWVEEDLKRLQTLYAKLEAAAAGAPRIGVLREIFSVAHDVKGQGGSFDYPLMTVIGNQLCRFIEKIENDPRDGDIPVIKVHVDALRLVISRRMSGEGGKVGDGLFRGLGAAMDKALAGRA